MTDHRITPPPELVQQWQDESPETQIADHIQYLMTRATQWGADRELEACCEWLFENDYDVAPVCLRTARRPTPLSLKEQALGALGRFNTNTHTRADEMTQDFDLIRLALEALDD